MAMEVATILIWELGESVPNGRIPVFEFGNPELPKYFCAGRYADTIDDLALWFQLHWLDECEPQREFDESAGSVLTGREW